MPEYKLPYDFFMDEAPDGGKLETDLIFLLNLIKPDILRYLTKGYIVYGMEFTNASGLTADISAGVAFVYGKIIQKDKVSHTFTNNKKTIIFLDKKGKYHYMETTIGGNVNPPSSEYIVIAKVWASTTLTELNEGKNFFLGYNAGLSNTSGTANIFIGDRAGYDNALGNYNTVLGTEAGTKESSSGTFIGYHAGKVSTGAGTFIGTDTGGKNTTGAYNVFVGGLAGYENTTGEHNVFIGNGAGKSNTTQVHNVFIGYNAGYNSIGSSNVLIGYKAGYDNEGDYGTIIGVNAGYSNEGDGNAFLGYYSGYSNTTGNNNTCLGNKAGYHNATGSGNVFIGNYAGYDETGSNTLFIDNQDRIDLAGGRAKALVYGIFDASTANQKLTINGLFNLSVTKTPASASDTGTTGDIAWDTDYIYVCTATNTWKRASLSSW